MPSRDLKIALIPLDIIAFNPKANIEQLLSRLDSIDKDTDLIVVPETFTSGFTPDRAILSSIAEPDNGPTITALRNWASANQKAIWGTTIACDETGNIYNRGFMIDDNGSVQFYDKRHLFSYGGENEIMTAGTHRPPTINYRSWNLRMSICYDLRFPVWNRARKNDYDILIVPANWAASRSYPWNQLLIARAIENQICVMGCNRTGTDHYGNYNPTDTIALDNWGKDISDRRSDGTVYATLSAEKFNNDRRRFAPWRDADDFTI